MIKLKTKGLTGLLAVVLALAFTTGTAYALGSYSLLGDASVVSPASGSDQTIKLTSDDSPGYGGISFPVDSGTTLADLSSLSVSYMFESDDSCMGGSPRFQIGVDTGSGIKNIFVYLGPEPNYTGCSAGTWVTTSNLLSGKIDTSQLGGSFYDTLTNALANYGSYPVTSISLVVDGGWAAGDGEQTVVVNDANINSSGFSFDSPTREQNMSACKNGGWKTMTNEDGDSFKNQGACVSHFAKSK